MPSVTIPVPDIGEFEDVEVIELLVEVGQRVAREDSLVTLESDKASVEIPSPYAGVVEALRVSLGDLVSEGAALVVLEVEAAELDAASAAPALAPQERAPAMSAEPHPPAPAATSSCSVMYRRNAATSVSAFWPVCVANAAAYVSI